MERILGRRKCDITKIIYYFTQLVNKKKIMFKKYLETLFVEHSVQHQNYAGHIQATEITVGKWYFPS